MRPSIPTLKKQLLLNGILVALIVGLWWYFVVIPHRPKGVPTDATPVLALGDYNWTYCWLDEAENVNRCQIFNRNGEPLYDEVFLRYEGQGPVPAADLKIIREQNGGGVQWIRLENGVILIPKSRYDRIRQLIDRQIKSRSPSH
ncbi:MAG: hypothetical protein ACRD2S_07220 [Terriglobales bacterium]